ncbi:hypothetical protein CH293_19490 [Rhodococcus sp. 14-2470-1b]|nr:hypothetical protein CH293_19490 [Rhodococcus sp. 14-2470-1b]
MQTVRSEKFIQQSRRQDTLTQMSSYTDEKVHLPDTHLRGAHMVTALVIEDRPVEIVDQWNLYFVS